MDEGQGAVPTLKRCVTGLFFVLFRVGTPSITLLVTTVFGRTCRTKHLKERRWMVQAGCFETSPGFIILGIMLVCMPLMPERAHHGPFDRMFWVTQASREPVFAPRYRQPGSRLQPTFGQVVSDDGNSMPAKPNATPMTLVAGIVLFSLSNQHTHLNSEHRVPLRLDGIQRCLAFEQNWTLRRPSGLVPHCFQRAGTGRHSSASRL